MIYSQEFLFSLHFYKLFFKIFKYFLFKNKYMFSKYIRTYKHIFEIYSHIKKYKHIFFIFYIYIEYF